MVSSFGIRIKELLKKIVMIMIIENFIQVKNPKRA